MPEIPEGQSVPIRINQSSAKPAPSVTPLQPLTENSNPAPDNTPPKAPKAGKNLIEIITTHKIRVAILVALVLLPVSIVAYRQLHKAPKPVAKAAVPVKKKAAPKVPTSLLTGLPVDETLATRPVTAVVIENTPEARPQSGLSEAGIVYEALAEGGITRYLGFFSDTRPPELGPVRSLRTYFIDWALEFNAPIAHVGGNADALDLAKAVNLKDMNQFYNGEFFYRSRDRVAPHNAYTTSDLIEKMEQKNNYSQPASFTPNARKNDQATATPAHPNIFIDYSYKGYDVHYQYDQSCNCYLRFLNDQPHIDKNTGQQIKVKNVVVEYMPTSYGASRIGEKLTIMGTPGSNKAIIFRDGGAVEGTWSKAIHTDRTKLLDSNGKEIPLNKGNTWFSIVPIPKTVNY